MANWLDRAEMLVGNKNIAKLALANIVIVGLGGVGGYVAEALARSGIGNLTLVDGDVYSVSNLNRQIGALTKTIGQYKAEVMARRIGDINSQCRIHTVNEFYRIGDFDRLFVEQYDYVVDAIDDTKAKVDLLTECYERNISVISSMGTGNKLDPSKLLVVDISRTEGCHLARSVRHELRKKGIFKGITVVYSKENREIVLNSERSVGSMVFVPATVGMMMASYIVRSIIGEKQNDG